MVPSGQASSSKPKRECNNTEYWKGSFFFKADMSCDALTVQTE